MTRIAGELADMVNVVDAVRDPHVGRLGSGLATDPTNMQHPGIEGHANHGVAGDQGADLFVTELTLMGNERSAVIVTGPDRPVEQIQRFPEGLVGQMRAVQDHVEFAHLPQQIASEGCEAAFGSGSRRVTAWAVMCRPDGTQSVRIGAFKMSGGHDRVGALQRQDVTDGLACGRCAHPVRDMLCQSLSVDDLHHLPGLFHRTVPRTLPLSDGPGDFGAVPTR